MPSFLPKPPSPVLQRGDPLARGLVGAWPFYEGAGTAVNDIAGRDPKFKASFSATTTWGSSGVGWGANTSVGSTQIATSTPSYAPSITTATFLVLLRRDGALSNYQCILVNRGGSNGFAGLLVSGGAGNTLTVGWPNSGPDYNAVTGLAIPSGEVCLAAASVTPAGATVYLCSSAGLKSYFNPLTIAAQSFAAIWALGYDPSAASRQWPGLILDARIHYGVALPTNDIAQTYQDSFRLYRPRSEWWRVALAATTVHRRTLGQRTGSRAA